MKNVSANPEQQAAIAHGRGPLRIMAGAGTGKTQTLTGRFVHLVDSGVPAHEILAVTFTNKAAGELRARVLEQLPRSYRELWITTFHGFCRRLLMEWETAGEHPPLRLLGAEETKLLGWRAAALIEEDDRLIYRGPRGGEALARDLMTVIDRAKDELLTVDDVLEFAVAARNDRLLDLARAFQGYEQLSAAEGARAFSDLAFDVIARLRSDVDLLAATRTRFQHILVDEFQDVNEAQFQLLRLLAPPDANLCVVGDPNQAIYAFRGGNSAYMRQFNQFYPAATTYHLTANYRSRQGILDRANALIAHDEEAEPFQLRAENSELPAITTAQQFANEEYEAEWIARQIRALLRQEDGPYAFADVAILLRSVAASAEPIRRALALNGIPYRIGKVVGAEYETIQDVLATLRLAIETVTWSDAARLAARKTEDPILLRAIEAAAPDMVQRDLLLQADADLPEPLPVGAGNAIFAMRDMVLQTRGLSTLPLPELLYQATRFSGHLRDGLSPAAAGFLRNLARVAEAMTASGATAGEFLAHLTETWDARSEEPPDDGHGVQILTIHAAKGLEWPVVFVAGLAEGIFPLPFRRDRALDMEEIAGWRGDAAAFQQGEEALRADAFRNEERRLAYVAITRAKDRLHLTIPAAQGSVSLAISPFAAEAMGSDEVDRIRRAGEDGLPVSVSDLAARLHSRRKAAMEQPVRDGEAARGLADILLAEWAVGKVDGALPLRNRRNPEPHDAGTSLSFSFSQLETYQKCPRQYLYRSVLKIETDEESAPLTLGSAVHHALESLNQAWLLDGEPPGDDAVFAALMKVWPGASFSMAAHGEQLRLRATAMLRRYYAAERERFDGRIPLAIEQWVEAEYGQHRLQGKIDLVLKNADGTTEIIDFKSGKRDRYVPKNSLQLFLYAEAWQQLHPREIPRVSYYCLRHEEDKGFRVGVEWDKKQAKSIVFTSEQSDGLRQTIGGLIDGITANQFAATPSSTACGFCSYRRICPDAAR